MKTLEEANNMPYSTSEVNYWLENQELLSAGTMVPPKVGEIIHIDTKMDKEWYDIRYKKSRVDSFNEGVSAYFKVISVKRYLRKHYFEVENFNVPFSKTTEVFEVFLEEVKED